MIADSTFLIHFLPEEATGAGGRARAFFARHRAEIIRTTAISIGEVAVAFHNSTAAWDYFKARGTMEERVGERRPETLPPSVPHGEREKKRQCQTARTE